MSTRTSADPQLTSEKFSLSVILLFLVLIAFIALQCLYMYVCVCVCVCVCMCIYMCIYVCIYTYFVIYWLLYLFLVRVLANCELFHPSWKWRAPTVLNFHSSIETLIYLRSILKPAKDRISNTGVSSTQIKEKMSAISPFPT